MIESARKLKRELGNVVRCAPRGVALRYVRNVALRLPAILRARTLVPADEPFAGELIELPTASLRWPGENFGLIRELVFRRVYEAVDGFGVAAGDRVVDLGANCGLFSCMAAARGARVVAVEAQRGFIDEIAENAERNGLGDRVAPVWAMIDSDTGALASEETRRRASHMRGLDPPVRDLDEILEEHGVTSVDLMKIDIEGAEFSLFADPGPWLARTRRIVAELHAERGDVLALVAGLEAAGFATTRLDSELRPRPSASSPSQFVYATRR